VDEDSLLAQLSQDGRSILWRWLPLVSGPEVGAGVAGCSTAAFPAGTRL